MQSLVGILEGIPMFDGRFFFGAVIALTITALCNVMRGALCWPSIHVMSVR